MIFTKLKKTIILGGILVAVLGFATWTYTKLQDKIISLEKETTTLQNANAQNNDTIDQLVLQSAMLSSINNDICEENKRLEAEVTDLRESFSKNDIGYLASKKPAQIEKIVNNATMNVGKDIEQITTN